MKNGRHQFVNQTNPSVFSASSLNCVDCIQCLMFPMCSSNIFTLADASGKGMQILFSNLQNIFKILIPSFISNRFYSVTKDLNNSEEVLKLKTGSFHLNGYPLRFHPHTLKLEQPCMCSITKQYLMKLVHNGFHLNGVTLHVARVTFIQRPKSQNHLIQCNTVNSTT